MHSSFQRYLNTIIDGFATVFPAAKGNVDANRLKSLQDPRVAVKFRVTDYPPGA
jgi:hypothetical protein